MLAESFPQFWKNKAKKSHLHKKLYTVLWKMWKKSSKFDLITGGSE